MDLFWFGWLSRACTYVLNHHKFLDLIYGPTSQVCGSSHLGEEELTSLAERTEVPSPRESSRPKFESHHGLAP